jgi:transposase
MRCFPRVQDFVSYCRLVKCAKESGGKNLGTSGKKIGTAHLRWAFAEAAVRFIRQSKPGKEYFAKLERKHGKAKALTVPFPFVVIDPTSSKNFCRLTPPVTGRRPTETFQV